ncbi:LytR/AlgR family response regulator transcription factor [Brochothrix thermosphacta]|uniref:LytR/AlgR family response regulator transcription factor n=1 Tax=Brochothrix thermosphacta TaxID=2756 RepID=UPI00265CFD94|nr:LytTR family DNA-binding domain-containing protein [Brochothrix thermosphacta]WKK70027.1 LytTR family DNA-binding domain-containing protein [Brochothrix thermosphacta]
MKVAICDDDPALAEHVNDLLVQYDSTLFETFTYYGSKKLIQQIDTEKFDCYILDIEMDTINGVELATLIRKKGILAPIVFLTSYKEYMEAVFQVQTFDYLLKPLDKNRFFQVLDRLKLYLDKVEDTFIFSINKNKFKLKMSDIVYFEKDKRQVIIHSLNEKYRVYISTNQLLGQLNNDFVQIHASFIINCSYIKELGSNFLLLHYAQESIELSISRRFKNKSHENIVMSMRGKL